MEHPPCRAYFPLHSASVSLNCVHYVPPVLQANIYNTSSFLTWIFTPAVLSAQNTFSLRLLTD